MKIVVNCKGADGEAERLIFTDATGVWDLDSNCFRVSGMAQNGYRAGQPQVIEFPREHVAYVERVTAEVNV